MDYEFVVEVRDFLRDVLVEHKTFEDANSAYHEYRRLQDTYYNTDFVTVTLIEPEEV